MSTKFNCSKYCYDWLAIKHQSFVYIQLNITILFQTIQFSESAQFKFQNGFIWPIERTLSGSTTPGLSGPGSNGNEGKLRIPSTSDYLIPSTSDIGWGVLLSAEMQSMHSAVPFEVHFTSSKSAWKSTSRCTWMCWRVWESPGAIRWPVADPGCGSRTRRRPTSPKRPRLGFRKSATTLYPSLTGPPLPRPEPAGLLRLVIRREHH